MSLGAAPPAPGATNAAPGIPPTNHVTAVVPPPLIPQDFERYGKILEPNSVAPYPFKLAMPGPGFGEAKIPSRQELDQREKLERLATLSDAEIRDQLEKWPAFSKMSLGDEGAMLTRIQQFREHRSKVAQAKAQQLGLFTLNPAQQARFEKEYWDKKLQMDRQLSQQFEPIEKASEQKLNEALFREFSSPAAIAQGAKPPAPAPKPAPPVGSPAVATH
jgi:hypothetical protein